MPRRTKISTAISLQIVFFLLCMSVRPALATLVSSQPEPEEAVNAAEKSPEQTVAVSRELPAKQQVLSRDEITKKLQSHPDVAEYLEAVTQMVQKYDLQLTVLDKTTTLKLGRIRILEKNALKPFEYQTERSIQISDLTNQMVAAFDALKPPAGFEKSHEVLTKFIEISKGTGEAHSALAKYYAGSVKPSFGSLLFKVESKKFLDELTAISTRYPTQIRQDTYADWRKKFLEDLGTAQS